MFMVNNTPRVLPKKQLHSCWTDSFCKNIMSRTGQKAVKRIIELERYIPRADNLVLNICVRSLKMAMACWCLA